MNPLLEAALSYARRGWPVFPLRPRSKEPYAGTRGFYDATIDEDQIRAWWEARPDSNIGIRTGETSGLLVLDLDVKEGKSADELVEDLEPLPDTPTVRTGGGGLQYLLAYPPGSGISITGGSLGVGIDTRGERGYIVGVPSIHPNGTAYKWAEFEDAPIAQPPQWLIDGLLTKGPKVRITADEKLTGGRHQILMTTAASMRNIGLVPAEIEATLRVMAANRLDLSDGRVITDKEIRDIAAWCGDKEMGTVTIANVVHGDEVAASLVEPEAEPVTEEPEAIEPVDPGAFPAHLLNVPGTIGAWCKVINATCFKEQPQLALAASIAAFGALIGRKVRTDRNGRSNLYCVGLCGSGGGKDHARDFIKQLFTQSGATDHLAAENIASDSAVESMMRRKRSCLFLMDEFGRALGSMNGGRASSHEMGIITVLLKMFTSAHSMYLGKAYADMAKRPVIELNQPNACVYGTSVPQDFYSALSGRDVSNGFIARLLVFVADDNNPIEIHNNPPLEIPDDLVADVKAWMEVGYGEGNVSEENPTPAVVPATDAARDHFIAVAAEVRKEQNSHAMAALQELWSRVIEKAWRLALIYACSERRSNPIIGIEAATWATGLCLHLTRKVATMVELYVSENDTESQMKRVLRVVKEAGKNGIPAYALMRKTRHLKARDRAEVVKTLMDCNDIFLETVYGSKGRPKTVYLAAKYRPKPEIHIVEDEDTPPPPAAAEAKGG